jgi:hypothetical protein
MFEKYSSGNKAGVFVKSSQANRRDKEKEMFDKLSRIEESYVDAAIRSVKWKFATRKNIEFET